MEKAEPRFLSEKLKIQRKKCNSEKKNVSQPEFNDNLDNDMKGVIRRKFNRLRVTPASYLKTVSIKDKLKSKSMKSFFDHYYNEVSEYTNDLEGLLLHETTDNVLGYFKKNLEIIKPTIHDIINDEEIIVDCEDYDEQITEDYDDNNINYNKFNTVQQNCTENEIREVQYLNKLDENLEQIGKYQTYTINQGCFIVLEKDSLLYLYGIANITILKGSVEICGKNLNEKSNITVYSPITSALLYIKNLNDDFNMDYKENIVSLGLDVSILDDIVLSAQCALLFCKNEVTTRDMFLEKNLHLNLYPEVDNNTGLRCTFLNQFYPDYNYLSISPLWNEVADELDEKSRLLFCGCQGVGKSTMLKYVINYLLNRYQKVLVIDLDPGQPEFTVSGCISAIVISEPLFGPAYTHLKKPDICFLIPQIDISQGYIPYLNSIQELSNLCREFNSMPTLINYNGYGIDFGVHIAASAIVNISPTHVVQIEGLNRSKNYENDLTPHNVNALSKKLLNQKNNVDFKFIKMKTRRKYIGCNDINSKDLREINIMSYLSQSLPHSAIFLTDQDVCIYRTNLDNLTIMANRKICSPMTVNANFVALCSPRALNDNSYYMCHGWGLVRAVSIEQNLIDLITPVSEEDLEKIDHLMLGYDKLPNVLYLHSKEKVSGFMPYIQKGKLGTLSKPPKRARM